jgi:hypothetical protein
VDGWHELHRLTESPPDGQEDMLNDRYVVTDLTCKMPGDLGGFALSVAYPRGRCHTRITIGEFSCPPSLVTFP